MMMHGDAVVARGRCDAIAHDDHVSVERWFFALQERDAPNFGGAKVAG